MGHPDDMAVFLGIDAAAPDPALRRGPGGEPICSRWDWKWSIESVMARRLSAAGVQVAPARAQTAPPAPRPEPSAAAAFHRGL